MRVLFINSVCGIRSTGRICTDLAEQYMQEGHEVRIAYGRENVPDQYRNISIRIGKQRDVYAAALKARVFDNEGFNNKVSTLRFLQWADNYNPDILWLHNLHGYYINIKLLFEWIKSRPQMQVKWTLHDCWAFTGHCTHFTVCKCNKWMTKCNACPQKNTYPSSILLDRSYSNYEQKRQSFVGVKNMTIIVPSNWLANLVKQSFLKNYDVQVIHNTIDYENFKYIESNFKESYHLQNKTVILGVSTAWNVKKGLSDFIQLSQMLEENYQVVLVGLTKKQKKKLPISILAFERTNSVNQLAEIYSAADVFLNLTYEDNYPTVNLEAQACGTPCITYNTGGSPESVPKENVVDVGDLKGVIDRIYQLCN